MMSDHHHDSTVVHPSIRGFIQDPPPNPTLLDPNPSSNNPSKRKRNLPGTPDPDAEVIALSPKSLTATNRFFCEICNKGFKRDQNLQLHRRGHNLPWKLKQRTNKEVIRKKVYICPEKTCVHHETSRALGDLTGIKKHYSRKHGEKKWKCEKCSKKYAVQSDWKAHSKICGTREYKCDCGTLFSRKDSFITHRAFCDALAEESTRFGTAPVASSSNLNFRNHDLMSNNINQINGGSSSHFSGMFRPEIGGLMESGNHHHHQLSNNNLDNNLQKQRLPMWLDNSNAAANFLVDQMGSSSQNQWYNFSRSGQEESSFAGDVINASSSAMLLQPPREVLKEEEENKGNLSEAISSMYNYSNNNNSSNNNQNQNQLTANSPAAPMSATALLQKAAQMGSTRSNNSSTFGAGFGLMSSSFSNLGSFGNLNNQNRNEEAHHHQQQHQNHQHQQNTLINGLMASTTSNNGDRMIDLSRNSDNNAATTMWKRSQLNIEAENSMTRDFLGVGGNDDENRRFLPENYNSAGGGEACFNGFRNEDDEPL